MNRIFAGVLLLITCVGCASNGSLVPNASTTKQQALINNEQLYTQLESVYDGAVVASQALWYSGKISPKEWTSKVSPAMRAASDALTAYRNAYNASLNPTDGSSGSAQAAQAAIQGIFAAIADFSGPAVRGAPPTTLPVLPSFMPRRDPPPVSMVSQV